MMQAYRHDADVFPVLVPCCGRTRSKAGELLSERFAGIREVYILHYTNEPRFSAIHVDGFLPVQSS